MAVTNKITIAYRHKILFNRTLMKNTIRLEWKKIDKDLSKESEIFHDKNFNYGSNQKNRI